jgi:hypothetical protein
MEMVLRFSSIAQNIEARSIDHAAIRAIATIPQNGALVGMLAGRC